MSSQREQQQVTAKNHTACTPHSFTSQNRKKAWRRELVKKQTNKTKQAITSGDQTNKTTNILTLSEFRTGEGCREKAFSASNQGAREESGRKECSHDSGLSGTLESWPEICCSFLSSLCMLGETSSLPLSVSLSLKSCHFPWPFVPICLTYLHLILFHHHQKWLTETFLVL